MVYSSIRSNSMSYESKAEKRLMTQKKAKKRKYKGDLQTLQHFLRTTGTDYQEFLRLNEKFYKKLKAQGFSDIEYYNPSTGIGQNEPYIKTGRHSSYLYAHRANEEFYRRARAFLHHHTFDNKLDEILWGYFSEGISFRKMVKLCHRYAYRVHVRTYATAFRRVTKYFPAWFAFCREMQAEAEVEIDSEL